MKTFLATTALFVFFSVNSVLAKEPLTRTSPFQFDEEVSYARAKDHPFLGFGERPDFVGVIVREDMPKDDRRLINVYHFSKLKITEINEVECARFSFFNANSSWKRSSYEIFKSLSGPVCEHVMRQESPDVMIREKRLFTIVMNNKVFGFMANLNKPSDQAQAAQFREFIAGLKAAKKK